MIRLSVFITLIVVFSSCEYNKQSEPPKSWYKGNLHTHSFWSDGDDFPEMIMDWYKSHDYDFIVLSDHNILARGEKWKTFPEDRLFIYEEYLAKYGEDWIETRRDSLNQLEVKLKTLAEYRSLFEEPGKFQIIQSEEISDRYEAKPIHLNATNVQELIEPQGGNSVAEVMQNNIDAVLAQRERLGVPMFPHINHPNFVWAITPDDMIKLDGERFFEVYNGHPAVHNYGDKLRPGMEELWDLVLTAYINDGKPPIYGLAVDDAHSYHNFGPKDSNPGRGWVMVYADTLSPEKLIEAMEAGDFYASTGVTLKNVDFKSNTLSVEVLPKEGVSYTIQFFGSTEIETGALFAEVKGLSASYTLKEGDLYVRAKVVSSKMKENPYKSTDMELAYTQPVMLEK